MWTLGIAKNRKPFEIQIVLADSHVGFSAFSSAKNDLAIYLGPIVKPYGKAAFHGHQIDHVDDRIDVRETFSTDQAAQQSFRGPAIARGIFAQRFVACASCRNF